MTQHERRIIVAVVVALTLTIGAIPLFSQPGTRFPRNRETTDVGRLRRTYDAEFGIVCYQNLYGNNETPFCLHER